MSLVSIVLPTYKRAKYLKEAVSSILGQTYHNWELIIVDDNPPDSKYRRESREVIEGFPSQEKIHYLPHQESRGGAAARNTGIKAARGEYIAFLDDDDLWEPTKLEKQIALFSKQTDLGLVYCKMYVFSEPGDKKYIPQDNLVRGDVFKDMLEENYMATGTALVKKECFQKLGLFDETLPSRQDHDMFLRICREYQVDFVEEYLAGMRLHQERISRNIEKKLKGWKLFLKKWESELEKYPTSKKNIYAKYNWEMGRLYYYHQDYSSARKRFLQVIKSNKAYYKAYLLYILSFLRIDINLK
ncbi:MAG: glycosyltransferase family 2 protein [bacterium]